MKIFIFWCVFWYALGTSMASDLTGIVLDTGGDPVPDAYVFTEGNRTHAHSNLNGRFTLAGVEEGDTVFVSVLGFEKWRKAVTAGDLESMLTITLSAKTFELKELVITDYTQTLSQLARVDLNTDPVNSSQELLRLVPGLFIGQHAGGGKAEQIFLRGFDIDHGTDVLISVEGIPVNMVSHAHGQGYADLHFIIPETIEGVQYGKGPHYADKGDFTTAGYVEFHLKESLPESMVSLEAGRFDRYRLLGMFDLLGRVKGHHAYVAAEYLLSDGPFESPQNFNRLNILGRYTASLPGNDRLSVLFSHFNSRWDASGQIPQRAVDEGLITRFGAIDDTEGGNTSRTNVALEVKNNLSDNSFVQTSAFVSHYDFELYSNFTFFLEDTVNGDQIKQQEDRYIFGVESEYSGSWFPERIDEIDLRGGAAFRYDLVRDNELSHTVDRKTVLDSIVYGDVYQSNISAFVDATFDFGKWRLIPGFRLDMFKFNYIDALSEGYSSLSATKVFPAPKLTIEYSPVHAIQLYLKGGRGFHSNDARTVLDGSGMTVLPAAYGTDLGVFWKPVPQLLFHTAFWFLYLEEEFVYVGDGGFVEPSGKTRRLGVDFSTRVQPVNWLFLDADLTYTFARSIDAPEGEDRIPLAPDLTLTGGVSVVHPSGFSAGLHMRYLKDRPANEDNSIVAEGYFVTDLNASFRHKCVSFGVTVENLFDSDWNETQFATESRLNGEPEGVEEIHFTPGTPFNVYGTVAFHF